MSHTVLYHFTRYQNFIHHTVIGLSQTQGGDVSKLCCSFVYCVPLPWGSKYVNNTPRGGLTYINRALLGLFGPGGIGLNCHPAFHMLVIAGVRGVFIAWP